MKTYYSFEFSSIPAANQSSLTKTLPNNSRIKKIYIEGIANGKGKITLTDLNRQRIIGVFSTAMNAIDGFDFDFNVSSEVQCLYQNIDTVAIIPTVTLQVES